MARALLAAAACACACVLAAAQDTVTQPNVFPPPYSQEAVSGSWQLDPAAFAFRTVGANSSLLAGAVARLRPLAFDYRPAPGQSDAVLRDATTRALPTLVSVDVNVTGASTALDRHTNESYVLEAVPGQAAWRLTAPTVYGAMRGLLTFTQLVQYDFDTDAFFVAGTRIVDLPRFEYRGVMVDTSRNFMSMASLHELCSVMELQKLNAIHLHLTDDQSWPIQIEGLPRLAGWLSYRNGTTVHQYTADEVRTLVAFCSARGVRVIPEVDMPSHFPAAKAYPEFFTSYCNQGHCGLRGLLDISREETFAFVRQIWAVLVDLFPGGEYHIGGDEVWAVPWSNSSAIQAWLQAHQHACPDDANITCGTVGDVQPYFTRRLIGILEQLRPGASLFGWAPGIEGFYRYGNLGARFPSVTYNNWYGWDPRGLANWQPSMERMTTTGNASVVLSGPFYVVHPKYPVRAGTTHTFNNWEQMLHTDILNFTAPPATKARLVRGAELVFWGDASGVDSGNAVAVGGNYLVAFAMRLWSPNGTVTPTDPDDPTALSCNGNDYSWCSRLDLHRCRLLHLGFRFPRFRQFGTTCAVL